MHRMMRIYGPDSQECHHGDVLNITRREIDFTFLIMVGYGSGIMKFYIPIKIRVRLMRYIDN
jgi:hypothetical protein